MVVEAHQGAVRIHHHVLRQLAAQLVTLALHGDGQIFNQKRDAVEYGVPISMGVDLPVPALYNGIDFAVQGVDRFFAHLT